MLGGQHKDIRFRNAEQAMLVAMRDLLEHKSFDEMTINDICIAASVSRTTFYQHFEDKYALALAWINADIKPPVALFSDDTMENYFSKLLEGLHQYRSQVKHLVVFGPNRELEWRLVAMWSNDFKQYYEDKHLLGATFDAPFEMMAVYNCSGVVNLIWWMIRHDFPHAEKTIVDYLVRKIRQSNELIHP